MELELNKKKYNLFDYNGILLSNELSDIYFLKDNNNIIYLQIKNYKKRKKYLEETINSMQIIMTNCYNNNISFYFIFDVLNVDIIDIISINKFITLFKKNEKILKQNLNETVICNTGTLTKFFSKLVFSVYTPVKPTKFLKNFEQSINYISIK